MVAQFLRILLLGWIGLGQFALASQVPLQDFYREVWTTRDGLSHNTVNSIEQTEDGYLWFAGWEGAARFDGRQFELLRRDQLDQLQDSGILVMQKLRDGSLVLGGARGGLVRLQGNKASQLPFVKSQVNSILEDQFGQLWVSTEGSGLFRISPTGEVTQFSAETQLRTGIINPLHQTEDGKIWLGTPNGLFWFDPAIASPRFNAVTFFNGMNIYAIAGRRSSELLIGADQGAFIHKKQQFQLLHPDLANITISTFMIDQLGSIWAGTFDKGLFRISDFGLENINASKGLPNNRILSLFQDREQSVWVGTNGGLFRLRGTPFRTLTTASGLTDNYVRTLTEMQDGSVWIGSSSGLDRFQNGMITAIKPAKPLKINSYRALHQTADGSIWVGTYADGALLFKDQQEVRRLNRQTGIGSDMVLAIHQAKNGQTFFGTSAGLSVLTNGQIKNYHISDGLPGEFVSVIREDQQGRLWIGTGHGAVIWQQDSLKVISLDELAGTQQVFDFYLDEIKQQTWMATDRGIVRYDWQNQDVMLLGYEQGLPVEKIFSIQSEDDHYFWLSSNHGITRILRSEIDKVLAGEVERLARFEHFGAREGMHDAQCNGGSMPSAIRHSNGSFWFSTAQGIARIHPDDLTTDQIMAPPAVIQRVWVDGRLIELLPQNLSSETRRIKFDFAGLSYLMPTRLQYRTKLEGFDPDWVERGTQFSAEYTNLPAGDYRFLVSVAYPDGEWSAKPAEFNFRIVSSFWQRYELGLALLLLIVVAMTLFYHWRMRHLRITTQELKQQVDVKDNTLAQQETHLEQLTHSHRLLVNQLQHRAEPLLKVDDLTELPTQLALVEHLTVESVQARTLQQVLSVVILDIDDFAAFNAKFGQERGDQVISRVANTLRWSLRETDFLARIGPQKFAIVLPDTTADTAKIFAEQLRLKVVQMHLADVAAEYELSCSVGIASLLGCGKAEPLLLQAEAMLSQAKALGRNRVFP